MNSKIVLALLATAGTVAMLACGNHGASSGSVNAAVNPPSTEGASGVLAPSSSDFGPMRTVEVRDPMFDNIVAYTISIPRSWNFEGIVLHGPGCSLPMEASVFRAYSPDMLYGIQAIPTSQYAWADDQGAAPQGAACKIVQPLTAEEFGRLITVSIRPDAVVDSVEASPNEASMRANLEHVNQNTAQQAASYGNRNPVVMSGEDKWLRIHYDLNGHPEEEILDIGVSMTTLPILANLGRPGQSSQSGPKHRYEWTPRVSGIRAPKGQLQAHMDAFRAISQSFKANPEWSAKYFAYVKQVNDEAIQRSRDFTINLISRSWAVTNSILQQGQEQQAQRMQQSQQFIANMKQQGDARNAQFAASMAAKDGHAKDVADYLLDQQLYVNPSTGQTQTQSNQFNYTYSNGSGPGSAVLQTNSASYDPNGQMQGNWTLLQPIHH